MQAIINEWQLGNALNQALQQQHRADFSLWLAFLSPAVDDMAAFSTPASVTDKLEHNLYQQFSIQKARGVAWQAGDNERLFCQSLAAQHSLAQLKLQDALTPEPWVLQDNPKKLADSVLANLDVHCIRRLQGDEKPVVTTDETALYEILDNLATHPQFV